MGLTPTSFRRTKKYKFREYNWFREIFNVQSSILYCKIFKLRIGRNLTLFYILLWSFQTIVNLVSCLFYFILFFKKRKKKEEEEEANLGLMIAPKFFESQKQNFCHVIKPLTCFLPLMHWWLLQNSWFFYVWCSLYDFGSLWVSFQDCPLACQLPSHFLVNFLLKASHAYFSLLYLSWALLANILVVPTHFITLFFRLPWPIYYLDRKSVV